MKKSGTPDPAPIPPVNGLDRREPEEEQPVRELAETIVAGHAFADVDAVRVARAFLRMDEEGT